MYKYEQRRKNFDLHSSGSDNRKVTIEFKCDLSAKILLQDVKPLSEVNLIHASSGLT